MATAKSVFVCSNCNFKTAKWVGKCPNCDSWNSLIEETISPINVTSKKQPSIQNNQITELKKLYTKLDDVNQVPLYKFEAAMLNQFWGGGLVPASLTLLAGEPGLGKSTLALQLVRSLLQNKQNLGLQICYLTAEESALEIAKRAKRLGIPDNLNILQTNSYEEMETKLSSFNFDILVVDSIQTIFTANLETAPGSVSQVTTLASHLLALGKNKNMAIIVIGHVTKEGQIAGPKTLEHLVDSVLILENANVGNFRSLRFNKHRYGATTPTLLMNMGASGLEVITNPSLALLGNTESGMGVAYGLGLDGDLPLVVEIQALVTPAKTTGTGNFFGRREALGIKTAKLNTILAICEKYLNLDLTGRDVYLQISGWPNSNPDENLDLAIMVAILSSTFNLDVKSWFKSPNLPIFSGRLTLSGNLRSPTQVETRTKTASSLKMNLNPTIKFTTIREQEVLRLLK
jgi:DNA repair protein RadA/Sms